jgi:small basic protein
VVAAVCGLLSGGFALSVGLLEFLVGLHFAPGTLVAQFAYFVGGFTVVGVSTGIFVMRPTARKLGIPVYLGTVIAFGVMLVGNLQHTPTALVGAIMAGINGIGLLALLASEDVEVGGRTDTSDKHATDIGTGFR